MTFKPDWEPNEDSQWKDESTVLNVIVYPLAVAVLAILVGVATITVVNFLVDLLL